GGRGLLLSSTDGDGHPARAGAAAQAVLQGPARHDVRAREGGRPPANLRHHQSPRRGEDHPHREAAALRGCHPPRRKREAGPRPHAPSDWMELEKERGISVPSSVLQFDYRGHAVNLLDTPGHQDFSEDTYRTLSAADSAVMLIDAAKGVEPQTKKLFQVCRM